MSVLRTVADIQNLGSTRSFAIFPGCELLVFLALLQVVFLSYIKKDRRPDAELTKNHKNDRKEWKTITISKVFKILLPLLVVGLNVVYFICYM